MSQPPERPPSGVSRRDFLTGSGAAAAATALSARPAVGLDGDRTDDRRIVRGKTTIALQVNGQSHRVDVEPRTTLLEVLRDQLGLTGAKPVSDDGISGASTVLVDGRPIAASTTLALAVRGKSVRTIEDLGGDSPDAVCRAFVEHDAAQCGFCTPGFVLAVRAFLDKHPRATDDEIRTGLNGNLCRCGTYANVLRAVRSLADGSGG